MKTFRKKLQFVQTILSQELLIMMGLINLHTACNTRKLYSISFALRLLTSIQTVCIYIKPHLCIFSYFLFSERKWGGSFFMHIDKICHHRSVIMTFLHEHRSNKVEANVYILYSLTFRIAFCLTITHTTQAHFGFLFSRLFMGPSLLSAFKLPCFFIL